MSLIYIRAGYVYRSNVLHMLLLHHIITRLALLNLVTRQSRKLLQRYNSISGKSKSIRPGGRAAHVCRRNENVRGCDVIRLSLSEGNYILRAAYKRFTPVADMRHAVSALTLLLIYVQLNRHRFEGRWNRSGDLVPHIARNGLEGPTGTDFSSFDFKIPLLYRNGGIVHELIWCGDHVWRWFAIQRPFRNWREKAKSDTANAFECELRARASRIRIITYSCTLAPDRGRSYVRSTRTVS